VSRDTTIGRTCNKREVGMDSELVKHERKADTISHQRRPSPERPLSTCTVKRVSGREIFKPYSLHVGPVVPSQARISFVEAVAGFFCT